MTIQNKKVKIYKRYENKLTIKDNEEIETLKQGIAIRILM